MNTAVAVITPAHRAAAFIRKGQRAWTTIKASAEEQRVLWLEVGVALMYGKQKENRPGQKFSEWCLEKFPGICMVNEVPHAIWFASEFSVVTTELPPGLSYPQEIRRWFNAQQAAAANTDPILSTSPAPQAAVVLDKRTAERVVKLHHRSATGDEGSPVAAKALKAYAKQHSLSEEALVDAAKASASDEFYRFSPPMQRAIDDMRASLLRTVADMERGGLSRDAIRDIFTTFAYSL